MSDPRWLVPMAVLSVLLTGADGLADSQPTLLPTRDVDIRYDVTRPQEPKVRERVRWLAGEHLERVDASGRSTSIFDRDGHVVTLLTPANRTFRKVDGAPRRPSEPAPGAVLRRDHRRIALHGLVVERRWRKSHALRHRRWRYLASDCRRTNLSRGALREVRATEAQPVSSAGELHAGNRTRRRRRALINAAPRSRRTVTDKPHTLPLLCARVADILTTLVMYPRI
jgi:hypothetical protein